MWRIVLATVVGAAVGTAVYFSVLGPQRPHSAAAISPASAPISVMQTTVPATPMPSIAVFTAPAQAGLPVQIVRFEIGPTNTRVGDVIDVKAARFWAALIQEPMTIVQSNVAQRS